MSEGGNVSAESGQRTGVGSVSVEVELACRVDMPQARDHDDGHHDHEFDEGEALPCRTTQTDPATTVNLPRLKKESGVQDILGPMDAVT